MWLEALAMGLGGLFLVDTWKQHRRLTSAMAPLPAPPSLLRHRSVTVIRPIKGLDPGLEENLRAGLDTGYPGEVETLFVFDARSEPAVAAVEKVLTEHRDAGRRGSAEILYCGPPQPGRTGKLQAMILGVQRAKGELIAFADSDIRTDRAALTAMVETLLSRPDAGSAFAPVAFSEPAQTLGDAVCAILLNGLYTPASAMSARMRGGELPFILGQFMVFTRHALDAIGGLEAVEGQLADDLYIGALVRRAGLRNLISSHPIRIIQYGLSPIDALRTFSRWITFSRTGLPEWSFKMRIARRAGVFWMGVLGAAGLALAGHLVSALPLALAAVAVATSVNLLHQRAGAPRLRPRHWLASSLTILLAPFIFARIYVLQRRVLWRGRTYDLDPGSRLLPRQSQDRQAACPPPGYRRAAP